MAKTAELDKVLEHLPMGSKVAVITLTGSLCPVTKAHVQCFVEGQKLLLGGNFGIDVVVGGLIANSDKFVSKKLAAKGLASISQSRRAKLAQLATKEYPWLVHTWDSSDGFTSKLKQRWPTLKFVSYVMNGADDVVKYKKWTDHHRQIVMDRPGSDLWSHLRRNKVHSSDRFVVGPKLEDISSSKVRKALMNGDSNSLKAMLHVDVARWCWDHGPYRPPRSAGPWWKAGSLNNRWGKHVRSAKRWFPNGKRKGKVNGKFKGKGKVAGRRR